MTAAASGAIRRAPRSAMTTILAVLLLLFAAASAFLMTYHSLALWFLQTWQLGTMALVMPMAALWWVMAFSAYRLLQRRNWARQVLLIGLGIVWIVAAINLVVSARHTVVGGPTLPESVNSVASVIDLVLIGIAWAVLASSKVAAECDGSRLRDFAVLKETPHATPLEKRAVASMRSAAERTSEVATALRRDVVPERLRSQPPPPRRPKAPRAGAHLAARRWVVRVLLLGLLAASVYFSRTLSEEWPWYALVPLLYGIILALTVSAATSRVAMLLAILAAAAGFVLSLDVMPMITEYVWMDSIHYTGSLGLTILLTALVLAPHALLMAGASLATRSPTRW